VTYLKLRRRKMLIQAEQMHKMTSILLKMVEVVILVKIVVILSALIFFSA